MGELLVQNPVEQYWEKAISEGVEKLVVSFHGGENQLLGRAFEYLGYAMISDIYPSPDFILTTPRETAHLKRCISREELSRWQPRFPDGMVFQRTDNQGSLKLVAIVEYKVPNIRHTENQGDQFDGFIRLLMLFRQDNTSRGKNILRKSLKKRIPQLEVPFNAAFIYVVPQGRTAIDTPTSLYGQGIFKELIFPQRVRDIRRRIRNIRVYK